MLPREELQAVIEATLERLLPHVTEPEPLLWNIRTAVARSGMPRDRLLQAFHAGDIDGLWSTGERGRGAILLKPESVRAWIEKQVGRQATTAPTLGRGKDVPAR